VARLNGLVLAQIKKSFFILSVLGEGTLRTAPHREQKGTGLANREINMGLGLQRTSSTKV